MKFSRWLVFPFFIFTACTAAAPTTGHDTGNGGDRLPIFFQEARTGAWAKVQHLRLCELSRNGDLEVIRWIADHQRALASDIENSPHYWDNTVRPQCGWTGNSPDAPISFSYDSCRPYDLEGARKVLIHESVHHLHGPDESFANSVVAELYASQFEYCGPDDDNI